jgi:glycine hydroxymethyltransferase
VAFGEALHPEFKKYMQKVLDNTKACNDELAALGAKVSGTDNHLFLLDVLSSYGINGKEAQARLGEIGLTVNKNMIHGDTLSPALTSGIRVGFAALTSRGATLEDAKEVARIIHEALKTPNPEIEKLKERTAKIAASLKDVTSLQYPSIGE